MAKFADNTKLIEPEIEETRIIQSLQDNDNISLLPIEKVLLTNIIERPLDMVDERIKTLGIHPSTMSTLHMTLSAKGIIKTVTVDKKKLFELTDKGRSVAGKLNIPIKRRDTRGGIEHFYWIHQTAQFLRKLEFQPILEKDDIDIVDIKNEIAVEVETGKSDIRRNLSKLENSQVSRCFMLTTNKETTD